MTDKCKACGRINEQHEKAAFCSDCLTNWGPIPDYENLDNIEACGECGTFHDSRYCPYVAGVFDDEAPFCELHPDTLPTQVRGVEGDDIGYECPACKLPGIREYVKQAERIDKARIAGSIDVHEHEAQLEAEYKRCTGLEITQQVVELCPVHPDTNLSVSGDWKWCCHKC